MHFAIPETREVKDTNGAAYTAFQIFVNGIFHCNVRYSQLYTLHESLKQLHGVNALPYFPPKKFFPLSKTQIEERQYCLQKYLQAVSQNSELVKSPVLKKFLLSVQQNIDGKRLAPTDLVVCLLNGTQVPVKVSYEDSSEMVLQKVCEHLRIPHELIQHLGLLVTNQSNTNDSYIIHYLQDYECPILTLSNIPVLTRVVIRKCYWDPVIDTTLIRDRSTLNVLYAQTVSDIERSWIEADDDTRERLASLQSRGAKREYLEIAKALKFYGYIRFDNCTCDFPELGTDTIISIGQKELVFTPKSDDITAKESRFRITRIRCWKITPLNEFNKEVQLSFEYLVNNSKLQWITIISKHVYVLSVCLQSVVDELMLKKGSNNSSTVIVLNPSSSSMNASNSESSHIVNKTHVTVKSKWTSPKTNTFNSIQQNSQLKFVPLLENDSFENIGDEDL